MKQLVRFIDSALSFTLAVAMTGILVAVVWQVISRYLLGDPASYTEEIARFLLIWIGILGAALAYRKRAHLGFSLLVDKLVGHNKKVALTLIASVVILFCAIVMVNGGALLVYLTWSLNQISASLGIKIGYIYSVLPLSGLLIIFYSLVEIRNLWQPNQQRKW